MTTIQRPSMQHRNSQAALLKGMSTSPRLRDAIRSSSISERLAGDSPDINRGPIVQRWDEAVQARDKRQSACALAAQTGDMPKSKSTVTVTPSRPQPSSRLSFAAALKSQPAPSSSKPKPMLERKQTLGRDAIRPWSDIFSVERMEKELDQLRKGPKGKKGGAFSNFTGEYSAYLELERTGKLPKAYEQIANVDIDVFVSPKKPSNGMQSWSG
jgi:hypothetical protein